MADNGGWTPMVGSSANFSGTAVAVAIANVGVEPGQPPGQFTYDLPVGRAPSDGAPRRC